MSRRTSSEVARLIVANDLERDLSPLGVAREIDDAHATPSEDGLDAVFAERFERHFPQGKL